MRILDHDEFERELVGSWEQNVRVQQAIIRASERYFRVQAQERKDARSKVSEHHRRSLVKSRAHPLTSKIYPRLRTEGGRHEWSWLRAHYSPYMPEGITKTTTLKRTQRLESILSKANDLEIETITRHYHYIEQQQDRWRFTQNVANVLRGRMLIAVNIRKKLALENGLSMDEFLEPENQDAE